jgi:hypothetical protein
MATLAEPMARALRRDRFFLILSLLMIAVIIAGFSFNLAMGRSSFGVPLVYHAHAFVFMGWVMLFLAQTFLVATENVRLHRTLGWVAVAWVPLMVVMGMVIMLHVMRTSGGPPFFGAPEFLLGNPAQLLCFAGLVFAAIVNRTRSDWHRRLMLCAMAILTGPGWGRLLPVPFMIPWSWVVAALVFPSIFPLIGIARDKLRLGRVHPAWLWGLGAMAGSFLVAEAIALTPLGTSLTQWVLAGSPGAARDFAPHFP